MQTGYGSGTYTGVYNGVQGTYNRAATNQAAWDAVARSGSTAADQQQSNRNDIEAAWDNAIDIQETHLTAVPSAIAYGALFGDQYAAAQRIAAAKVPHWGDTLWSMMTNLQPKVNNDGSLGTWAQWSPPAAQVIRTALQNGGVVGFQTAGYNTINT